MHPTLGLTGLILLAIVMSFLGALHPVGDSLAVFRVGLCAALIALTIAIRPRRALRLTLVSVGIFGIATMAWHKIPRGTPGPITVYQKNLFHANSGLAELIADIRATGPDFVTLQEVSVANDVLFEALRADFPHQFLCRKDNLSGIAVLSRLPTVGEGACSDHYGFARITVDLPGGRHHVASIHLLWPFPGAQPRQMERLRADMAALDHPILFGGDFNMVPWASALPRLARASGTARAGPARTTFLLGSVPISIDHVFAPGGGTTETRPRLGGDHFGVLARVHGAGPALVSKNSP